MLRFPHVAVVATVAASLALGFSTRRAASGVPFKIYYTANRQGEVEPCGCAVNQIGGLGRLRAYLAKDAPQGSTTFFADAGDTFFAAETLNPYRRDQDILRARVVAEGYRRLGIDAILPGPKDFAAGIDVLRELRAAAGTPLVAANLTASDGKPLVDRYKIVTRNGARVAFTGIADETAFQGIGGVAIASPLPALRETLSEIRKEGVDAIVVMSQLGTTRDKEISKEIGVAIVLGGHTMDALSDPIVVDGKAWLVQTLPQGEQLGVLELAGDGGPPTGHRLVDLGKELDGDNELTALVARHKDEIRGLALSESTKAQPVSGDKPFVANARTCRGCHTKQYEWWAGTQHASAYLVLYAKNQHFDPECVGCHSLGFEQPGGFAKIALPIVMEEDKPRKGKTPFVEQVMAKVFAGDARKPLDSRVEPKRYAELKKKYHAQVLDLEMSGKLQKLYIGVQCEHCHGNRNGHPNPDVPTVKKVSESSCVQCHKPPHDNHFDFAKNVKKIGCPLASGS